MSKAKKGTSNKFSILAICFIALVVFATVSLYVMVTRGEEVATAEKGEVTTPQKDIFQNAVSQFTLVEKEKKLSTVVRTPPDKINDHQSPKPETLRSAPVTPEHTPDSGSLNSSEPLRFSSPPFSGKNNLNRSSVPTLHAVTYASHGGRDDRFCRAIESAVRHEIDLIILGWGVKWKGLSQKLEAAHTFAQALPKDDIILFTDAFDVMFTNNQNHILSTYQELASKGKDIIFAGECGCWPHVTIDHGRPCFDKYPKAPTPYRYLNSGTWIGKAAPSAAMLHAVQVEAGKDFANANDQELVANMFIEGRFGIALDYHAQLFQSMHLTLDKPLPRCKPIEDIQVVGKGQLYNKRTNTYPAVFHFNGGGKRHHLDMEGKLWYKKSEFNTKEELEHLKKHRLRVPVESNMGRTLPFDEICPSYFKSNEGGGGRTPEKQRQPHQPEQFQRKERKTQRGRSITLKRRREY